MGVGAVVRGRECKELAYLFVSLAMCLPSSLEGLLRGLVLGWGRGHWGAFACVEE